MWSAARAPRLHFFLTPRSSLCRRPSAAQAAAVGIDWFYELLSPAELAAATNATLTMGLAPFACCYNTTYLPAPGFPVCEYLDWCGFPTLETNWNPVISSLTALGAIGLAGEAGVGVPWADAMVTGALGALPLGLVEFHGDGLYAESVEYAGYVFQFITPLFQALEYVAPQDATARNAAAAACLNETHWAALGSFSHTTLLGYNWADADDAGDTSQMVSGGQMAWAAAAGAAGPTYFVRRMVQSALPASFARAYSLKDDARQGLPNFVLFYAPGGTLADYAATPHDLAFLSKQVLAVRGGAAFGTGPADTFFAAKGLDGQDQKPSYSSTCAPVDHNNLDAGSFVWDMAGERFAIELGYENYGVLNYFGPERYTYYRPSTFGQNTVRATQPTV